MKDSGIAKSKTKKRITKEVKRDLHFSSASIDDSSDGEDEFQSNLNLIGASLGFTLDGILVRSKNDVFEDFLHEIN
ncbi:hypothetical protein Tco_1028801 [Tanacetum coccineum]|uniref:Uncharacterized protein n=1 Tax=Tanacetum coccineum TaxID=301880 RepID=A0ABQ5G1N2_9ASTR